MFEWSVHSLYKFVRRKGVFFFQAAFKAVMSLWNKKPLKVYGGRMSESMLAILCNIIKGENIIKERLAKEREEMGDSSNSSAAAAGPSTSGGAGAGASPAVPMATSAPNETDVNEAHLQQVCVLNLQDYSSLHCLIRFFYCFLD